MTRLATEMELKIAGSSGDVSALRRSRRLAAMASGEGVWERLVSTYYDTPDGRLQAAGVSLRHRVDGSVHVQTVKAETGVGGTVLRHEIETPIAGVDCFPAPTGEPSLDNIVLQAKQDLRPVARTATDRWSCQVDTRGAQIEAAFDIGVVEAFRGKDCLRAPLAEVEFELLGGPRSALFSVARAVLEESDGRLRLGGPSKLERARRLTAGGGYALPAEPRFVLAPDALASQALKAAVAGVYQRLIDVVPVVTDTREPEGVHQARVALRRFRAVERLFRKMAQSQALRDLAVEARTFAREFAPARDWAVFTETALEDLMAAGYGGDGARRIAEAAFAERASCADAAARVAGSARFQLFVLDLIAFVHGDDAPPGAGARRDRTVGEFATKALDRRLKRAKALGAAVRRASPPEPEAAHALRIELKKLRYAAQLFRSIYPKATRRDYMAEMARLQDRLGALNDAVVAQRLVSDAARGQGSEAARAAGFVAGMCAAKSAAALDGVAAHWAAFAALQPFWRPTPVGAAPAPLTADGS